MRFHRIGVALACTVLVVACTRSRDDAGVADDGGDDAGAQSGPCDATGTWKLRYERNGESCLSQLNETVRIAVASDDDSGRTKSRSNSVGRGKGRE